MNIDDSTWIPIHSGVHNKTASPWEEFSVVLPFPTDKIIVTVNLLSFQPTWTRAGYVYQSWSKSLTASVLTAKNFIPLNKPICCSVEKLAVSTLWVRTMDWIDGFQLIVEARSL